jgi:hypothetical protein
MFEIFSDSPAIQWMKEDFSRLAREEERKKAEEEHKKAEEKADEERKKLAAEARQTALLVVSQRFQSLVRPAKAQLRSLNDLAHLQQLIRDLLIARDSQEAQNVLFPPEEDTNSSEDIPTSSL